MVGSGCDQGLNEVVTGRVFVLVVEMVECGDVSMIAALKIASLTVRLF